MYEPTPKKTGCAKLKIFPYPSVMSKLEATMPKIRDKFRKWSQSEFMNSGKTAKQAIAIIGGVSRLNDVIGLIYDLPLVQWDER